MLKLTLAATLFAAAIIPAEAQQNRNCAERAFVIERLETKYGESRQSIGLGANNSVIEVFASTDTGTWTITMTVPAGQTCILASGESFESTLQDVTPVKGTLI